MSLTALAKYGPEVFKHIHSILGVLNTEQVVDVVQQGAEVASAVSATVNDSGASQSTYSAKQALLGPLESLVTSLNGQDPERKGLLLQLVGLLKDPSAKLTSGHRTQLKGIIEGMIQSPVNEEEIEKRVNEKLAQAGLTGDGIPNHWADKVLKGVSGILVGEVKNLNSPIGWAIKLYGKITGKEFNKESVNQFLGKFVDDNFKGRLQQLVEAKVLGKNVSESVFNGLTDKEKIGMEWVGKIAYWGSKTPKFIFDAIAATGVMIDASAEMLHNVPILGSILKIPLVRMTYTHLAAFFGRFSQDIDLISKGAQELKDTVTPKSQRVEPTAQTSGSK